MTTGSQILQMAQDTTIDAAGKFALVAAPDGIPESDPRFYYDTEWLSWFQSRYPEWEVVAMRDSLDATISWKVQLKRRPSH